MCNSCRKAKAKEPATAGTKINITLLVEVNVQSLFLLTSYLICKLPV